jgi:site-specific DNA-cytosine methylase
MKIETREIRHFHLFCGLGGGAAGFNRGSARVGNMQARFRCIGGIDVDPAGIRDFEHLAGVPGTVMDLFDREQYTAFHGREPGPGWRETTTADIHRAAGFETPHIVFLSAPCKGFSGLLAEKQSGTAKYQALNGLTLRGVFLTLEAFKDDPVELYIFENVPRIMTRGRKLLDRIVALFNAYGYAVAETTHDCGEIGGLAQSRKRFLLVARHRAKVPPYLYEPMRLPLRGVGEILGKLPMPGDVAAAGPMHRVPALQWKTWVRLAFVEAGKDWRSLNALRVGDDGNLLDFGIAREWRGPLGVNAWQYPCGTIAGRSGVYNGDFSVADPRYEAGGEYGQLGVQPWDEAASTVRHVKSPIQGRFSVADPRGGPDPDMLHGKYRVEDWSAPARAVIAGTDNGAFAVSDPRHHGPAKHCNEFRIVPWTSHGGAVTSAHGSGQGVADPRTSGTNEGRGKYRVTAMDETAGTVISESGTGNGAFAVADPRPASWRDGRQHYEAGGHYGVVAWDSPSGTVASSGSYDNMPLSVGDPREAQLSEAIGQMPAPADRLVCRIEALDGTWHRPFTTLELAALQSLFDPDQLFSLDGISDSAWRERIGNAVPRDAAAAIASTMGRTLLLAWAGGSFLLSADPIWVQPITMALAVDVPARIEEAA